MDASTWRDRIILALESEERGLPGKAGETPLSQLAGDFDRLNPASQDVMVAMNALVSLIKQPAVEIEQNQQEEYWSGLSFLVQYLPISNKQDLKTAFRTKLFGRMAVSDNLKVFALNGYVSAGGRLYPKELKKLKSILEINPIAWLDAAVISGRYDLVRESILKLIEAGAVNINRLLIGLDLWDSKWQQGDDFLGFVAKLRAVAKSQHTRDKISKWLERRDGYISNNGEHVSVLPLSELSQQINSTPPYWNGAEAIAQ